MARHGAEEFMSKSTIALIITWVIIGLVGAFFGGYFIAKKYACKTSDQSDNVITTTEGSSTTTSTSTSDTSDNGNKTIVQPTEQK